MHFLTLVVAIAILGDYIDWSFFQIVGVIFTLIIIFDMEDKSKTIWKRVPWAFLTLVCMVLIHYFVNDSILEWIKLIFSVILLFVSFFSLINIFNLKPGDGSVLTVYMLMLIFSAPVGLYMLFNAFDVLGIMP